ncbi:MFS transporter [Micromonospora sp. WMMA1363]|uniref:MFS transporter n=1 Tax=Micromonospora sp. WMMA1363 TaxID=3053985 RepID=UPI00259CF20C|nr:MFS transporter [Micromonospora sp. WMMA1363]MDM4722300.1 MFS transporter [Micromonospora sp. WMMA1363]
MSAAAATRRYALLSFLTWLPTGLYLAPLVLLMLDRNLSVGLVAAVGAVYSIAVVLLELPTGGMADVLGRRPVLVASAVASAAGLLILGLAETLPLFIASAVLRGVARALASGPTEAWYVDTLHAADGRDADPTTGLARGEVAASVALAAGTLAGGLLPLAVTSVALPVSALAVPVPLAAAVEAARTVVTLRLPEPQYPRPSPGAVLRAVPATIVAGLRMVGGDRLLGRLLLVAGGIGIALGVVELFTPAWLAELTGTRQYAAVTYAVVAALSFAADAAGSAFGPALVRRCGTPARAAAVGTAVGALAMAALAGTAPLRGPVGVLLAGLAYCLVFAGLGAAAPAQASLLHGRVEASSRTTVLSVQSLFLQLAAAVGVVGLGWLAEQHGLWAGYAGAAGALLACAALLRQPRRRPSRDPDDPPAANAPGPPSTAVATPE